MKAKNKRFNRMTMLRKSQKKYHRKTKRWKIPGKNLKDLEYQSRLGKIEERKQSEENYQRLHKKKFRDQRTQDFSLKGSSCTQHNK